MRFIIIFIFFFSTNAFALDTGSLKQTMSECKKLINSSNLGQKTNQTYWPFHQDEIIKQPSKMLIDGKQVEIYYCRTKWIADSEMTDDEYTPFVFVNSELNSIGWEALGGPQTFGASEAELRYDRAQRAIIACRLLGLNC